MNDKSKAWEEEHKAEEVRRRIKAAGIPKRFMDADISECPQKVLEWAERAAGNEPPVGLLIQGDVGRGKTHCTCAAIRHAIEAGANAEDNAKTAAEKRSALRTARFTTLDDILRDVKRTYDGEGSEADVLRTFENTRLLALDDLGKACITKWSFPILFSLIDRRYASNIPTIITTQMSIKELASYLTIADDAGNAKALISRLSEYDRLCIDGQDRRLMS